MFYGKSWLTGEVKSRGPRFPRKMFGILDQWLALTNKTKVILRGGGGMNV